MPDTDKPEEGAKPSTTTETDNSAARIASLEEQLETALKSVETWKGHAKTWEERSKENFEKAKKFDEIEEANKTELEKANARAEAAEKAVADRDAADKKRDEEAAAKAALEKSRAEIWGRENGLKDRGLPESVLRGATAEELEAHAKELLESLPVGSQSGSGGGGSDVTDGELTADDIVAQVTAR